MRPIADYVSDLRALRRIVRAISVADSCDDVSVWYEVLAVLERPPSPAPSAREKSGDFDEFELEDSWRANVHVPPDVQRSEAERPVATEFGQAVAAALGVPCYVNPPEEDRLCRVDWCQQEKSSRLVELLAKARHVLVLCGRGFAPAMPRSAGLIRYADLQDSAEARLAHWTEKLEAWERLESWKRTFRIRDPYSALARLDRRGILEGVIVETPLGHLQASGLGDERIAEIHGSLTEVECLTCHRRAPSAPAIEAFRILRGAPHCFCGGWLKFAVTAWGQKPRPEVLERARRFAQRADLVLVIGSQLTTNPSARIALDPVRSRGVPLAILTREATPEDSLAALIIDGLPEDTLPFTADLLG